MHCFQLCKSGRGLMPAPARATLARNRIQSRAVAKQSSAQGATAKDVTSGIVLSADSNYTNLCSNMGEVASSPVSGYAGKWSRYQGASLDKLLAEGDIIYGFVRKAGAPDVTQVWKAEEGDLNSPKLQSQRDTLPQLQKDPLQLQLDMDTLIVEVSKHTPLVDPSFASVPTDKLSATMKTLAVPHTGNLVVTGALPIITEGQPGQQADIKGHPEVAKTWFNRMYLRVPGEEPGSSNRWSVMVHYDTTTGQLLTHYHTWEAGIHPQPQQLQQVFSPGAHTQLMQEQHNRHTSIRHLESSVDSLANMKPVTTFTSSVLQYSGDGSQCTYSSNSSPAGTTTTALLHGGPGAVEVWYDSCCYLRVPATLDPHALAGQDVIFEVGALIPAPEVASNCMGHGASVGKSAGLVRWLVCYSSTEERRLKWARNELFML